MGAKNPYYLIILQDELNKREQRNPNYSLRSFALSLEVDPSQLSRILNRKQPLTTKLATKIVNKLSLNQEEIDHFIISAAEEMKCKDLSQNAPHLVDCTHEEQKNKN